MENKLITGIIGVVVVFALLGYALVPVIDNLTDGGTETQTLSQEGAGWVRMVYDSAPNSYYAVNLAVSDDAYTATNNIQDGAEPDVQSGSDDSILYADSNLAVWGQDGSIIVLGTDADGANYFLQSDDGVRVVRSEDKVEVFDVGGTDLYATFGVPSYAFIPVSTGGYGFFENGTEAALQENVPAPIVGGGFAGVYAYGNIIAYDLPQRMQTEITEDGKLAGAYWEKPAAAEAELEDFDPSSITITPLDPGVISIDPEPDVVIMAVPTPTYTDGDWGYDLNNGKATIVSYSGTGGAITVPATVGGYPVYQFGKGGINQNVFETSLSITDLVISPGIEKIGAYALRSVTGFTGSLTIPDTVTEIGAQAFAGTKFTGQVFIPGSVKTIGVNAFNNSSNMSSLVLSPGIETIGLGAFNGNGSLKGALIIPDTVTTIGNQAFAGTKFTTIVIPHSVTSIGAGAFNGNSTTTGLIIASDAIPGDNNVFYNMSSTMEVLDLSDVVDYSVDRYGMNANVTVSDSIGDAIGYISYSEIEITVPGSGGLGGSAASLLYVIPAVIIATLLIAAVGWFVYNRY